MKIKSSTFIIFVFAIIYILLGYWVVTRKFKGELPDGRWEWQIGTNKRITEVIKLEDQHGEDDR